MGHTDINQKVMMAKGFGFKRKLSDTWFDELRELLDDVRTLQEKRNRYVHDVWVLSETGPSRERMRVAIRKPQSRQHPELSTYEKVPVGIEEIWDVVQQVAETTNKIDTKLFDVLKSRPSKQP